MGLRKRILIVDDEPAIGLLYKEELEDEGYEVRVASNGPEALANLAAFRPDLVTLDVKMPGPNGPDGIATLRAIKARRRDLPVILCTGYSHYRADFGSWACDAYVVKSSDLGELKAAVRRALEATAA